jgi:hypothetical protein
MGKIKEIVIKIENNEKLTKLEKQIVKDSK